MKERIATKVSIGWIHGVAEINPDEFTLLRASHVIRDTAYADANFEDELVLYGPTTEIKQKFHSLVHCLGAQVPITAAVPVIVHPFGGKALQHRILAGH